MNKKIIGKLLALALLSFSLISCGQKDNISKSNNESQGSIKESMQEALTQSLSEEEYYNIIKEAKQRQLDYINSIKDPNIKQSVQTPLSAAIEESTFLYIKYPDDTDTIDIALKRVLNEE